MHSELYNTTQKSNLICKGSGNVIWWFLSFFGAGQGESKEDEGERERERNQRWVLCMLVKGCAVSLTNRNVPKLLTGNWSHVSCRLTAIATVAFSLKWRRFFFFSCFPCSFAKMAAFQCTREKENINTQQISSTHSQRHLVLSLALCSSGWIPADLDVTRIQCKSRQNKIFSSQVLGHSCKSDNGFPFSLNHHSSIKSPTEWLVIYGQVFTMEAGVPGKTGRIQAGRLEIAVVRAGVHADNANTHTHTHWKSTLGLLSAVQTSNITWCTSLSSLVLQEVANSCVVKLYPLRQHNSCCWKLSD